MLTYKLVHEAKDGNPALYLVLWGSEKIGLLEKYPNTKTETHPWKAYIGVGQAAEFIGSHYGKDGRSKACRAIQERHFGYAAV
jgi:hypothetical protein